MARPRIEIDVAEVERLAKIGLNETQIALALGCSPDTLRRRKRESEALMIALDRGKHQGIAEVAGALFKKAMDGDVRAMKLYLNSRAGWARPEWPEAPSLAERQADRMLRRRDFRDLIAEEQERRARKKSTGRKNNT